LVATGLDGAGLDGAGLDGAKLDGAGLDGAELDGAGLADAGVADAALAETWLADSGLVDDAVLLTSELVTNAVVHAGTQVQVTCKLVASAVEVVVRDSHPARMVPGPAPDESVPAERTGGRGLLLPSALASAWGVSYGTDAKAVWFRMGLKGDRTTVDEPGADPEVLDNAVPAVPWSVQTTPPRRADGAAAGGVEPASVPGYDELLRKAVGSARVIVAADAAYALVADEDGDLSVRAATGVSLTALLRTAPSVSTVPFIVDGRIIGVLAVAAVLPGRFGESDVQRLQQLADRVAPALERARLAELERARRARIEVLAEASELLAGPLDPERILAVAGQVAVPRLAAWCAVLVAGPAGELHPAVARHADESQAAALAWLLERACASGRQVVVRPGMRPSAPDCWPLAELAAAGAPAGAVDLASRGAWCFPLVSRGTTLGLLALGGPHAGRPSREVLGLAEDLAGRIALALENSRLAAQQQLASQALRVSLVPPELPRIPGVELAFAHDLPGAGAPAAGGDFCDVFPAGDGRWRFAIGEVCGTGPATLAVTSLARNTLRILGAEGLSVPAVLGRLNQLILDERAPGTFLTLVHGEIVTGPSARISLACAGQPLPLVLRAPGDCLPGSGVPGGGQPEGGRPGSAVPGTGLPATELPEGDLVGGGRPEGGLVGGGRPEGGLAPGGLAEGGSIGVPQPAAVSQPVLGVIEGLNFTAQEVTLSSGDLLLCVTDGVTRRRDGDRLLDDDDGLARLLAGCAGLTADVVAVKVHEEVRAFGGRPAVDGMAVLALRASS
jgi:GAF domain-containing protein/anti-sigma regulatory factor (Ser/Thr protein kinase)